MVKKELNPKVKKFGYDEIDAMNAFLASGVDLLGNGVVYKDTFMVLLYDEREPKAPPVAGMSKEEQMDMVREELKKVYHNRIAGELELRLWKLRNKKKQGGKEKVEQAASLFATCQRNCELHDEQIGIYASLLDDLAADKFKI